MKVFYVRGNRRTVASVWGLARTRRLRLARGATGSRLGTAAVRCGSPLDLFAATTMPSHWSGVEKGEYFELPFTFDTATFVEGEVRVSFYLP